MARKTVVKIVDDLDGTELEDGEGVTVEFALDNTSYEIDLAHTNADKLRGAMDKYIAAARRTSSGKRGRRSLTRSATTPDPKAVRAWAKAQGIEMSPRGRVPADVVKEFQNAGH